ncbi:MAG TPA: NAD-dependent epimerase/dehydratase family protein [candidate division WOR-3 bacterium]|uniref:NAD-dependent epimerase/dehydratase family protein n=1 Tax=candidate division WOR-3 bacterium TaxID=2052148 RepID=A0A7V0XG12_UNCW3|nr:NAD-dependent epimerase/dehydratase family protein [candidate division WOR-3 bacterium]
MKTILVTGGCGFIGSNFIRHYYDRHPDCRILNLDLLTYAANPDNIPERIRANAERYEFWYGNVCNPDLVNSLVARADIVVHFAAESHVARSLYDNRVFFETDVLGTHAVANAVVKHADRVELFVHISTSEVYGTAETQPMTEEHPLNPMSPYAAAKAGADRLVYSYIETYRIPATIIRPFNQYGPNQHLEKVVPRFITSALRGRPLELHGGGSARRDWLYVEDLCERLDRAISRPEQVIGQVFNFGSGEVCSVLDIAGLVLDHLGKPNTLRTSIEDRPGQVDLHVSSTDKAARVLGIKPGRPFKQGLVETIDWYVENEQWWKRIEWMSHPNTSSRW